jgi:hypothetical protein
MFKRNLGYWWKGFTLGPVWFRVAYTFFVVFIFAALCTEIAKASADTSDHGVTPGSVASNCTDVSPWICAPGNVRGVTPGMYDDGGVLMIQWQTLLDNGYVSEAI